MTDPELIHHLFQLVPPYPLHHCGLPKNRAISLAGYPGEGPESSLVTGVPGYHPIW